MSKLLPTYVALVCIGSMALLAYLATGVEWQLSTLGEMGLFILLIVAAGSFPLPVAPTTKADVSTAVLFGAVLLLDPGIAALTGAIDIAVYNVLLRYHGERMRWPWYQYPFNAAATALYMGLASLQFQAMAPGDSLLTFAAAPTAIVVYMVNTVLITGAVSAQFMVNPLRFWWTGTKENGPAEVSLLAFGFLGAVVYEDSPWTVVALFIPVAVIYVAFSRLARSNSQLADALRDLVSTSKLASVGAISLDLAHQIKNPLAIMLGRLEGLQGRLEEGTHERRHLDIAQEAGWRIQELTQTFTNIGRQEWVSMDIRELLDEGLGMAGLRTSKRIETRWSCSDNLPKVQGNPVLIREALSNFFSNALEAVEDGGQIGIDASLEDEFISVKISDNGVGIPPEELKNLFQPFHTTKPNGQGLGLFAAKHILEMHRGSVEIQSSKGSGSTVIVKLPVVGPEEPVNPFEDEPSVASIGSRPVEK